MVSEEAKAEEEVKEEVLQEEVSKEAKKLWLNPLDPSKEFSLCRIKMMLF